MSTHEPLAPVTSVQEELFSVVRNDQSIPSRNDLESPVEAPIIDSLQPIVTEKIAPASDQRERVGHLIKTLDLLAEESRGRGYDAIAKSSRGAQKLQEQYGDSEEGVTAGVRYKLSNANRKAFTEFAKAYGTGADPAEADETLQQAFDEFVFFRARYAGSGESAKARNQYRKQLKLTTGFSDPFAPKAQGDPYIEQTVPRRAELSATELDDVLDTRGKLEALRDDDRAGFLPTTNTEKNQAFELLDYKNNPDYPGGVYQRLKEISDHQVKVARAAGKSYPTAKQEGVTAVQSVVNEYGDYLASARRSLDNLQKLKAVIDDTPNPALTLAEVLEENPDTSADELMRFVDLFALRERGEAGLTPVDPLLTIENRQLADGHRNKVVEDIYTTVQENDVYELYKQQRLQSVRVVTVRKLMDQAIADQTNRAAFWLDSLTTIRAPYRRFAEEVLQAS